MKYVFNPEFPAGIPVRGSDALFAVRRIYCVGRNYAAHAREMGSDPSREPPFFFCKPANAAVPAQAGQTLQLRYPSRTQDYQHEIELVVAIGAAGREIPVERATDHIWGYGVGLDMTRRDLQAQLKEKGRPWELGKAFDESAPIGPLSPASQIGHLGSGGIWLKVDGAERQRSDISNMTWSVAEVVANLSTWFELRPGDLIFTGTPEGVGPVTRGQVLEGGIEGLGDLRVSII